MVRSVVVHGLDSRPRRRGASFAKPAGVQGRAAFTLLELLVSMLIISILVSLSAFVFRRAAESSVLAQARNALVTYTQVARGYAIANRIETMLVVNPYNGRFEVWHLNPPPEGGPWDALSSGTAGTDPWNTDGYAFAPVLDSSAKLPQTGEGRPAAAVHPIDYADRPDPAGDPGEVYLDNLTWAAFCFDESGQLVVRTRRIATRTYYFRDGTLRSGVTPNRLQQEAVPDLTLSTLVEAFDTPITSTRGFVISDAMKMRNVLLGSTSPETLVQRWLLNTREGQPYGQFAETVVLNRFSGQQLTGVR